MNVNRQTWIEKIIVLELIYEHFYMMWIEFYEKID